MAGTPAGAVMKPFGVPGAANLPGAPTWQPRWGGHRAVCEVRFTDVQTWIGGTVRHRVSR